MSMAWIYLLAASVLEVVWAIGLKYAQGFTQFWPSAVTVIAYIGSFIFLGLAVRTLPIGTGYAVWVGIGMVGTAILGMVLFKEPADAARIFCLVLIIAGVAGLKYLSGKTA